MNSTIAWWAGQCVKFLLTGLFIGAFSLPGRAQGQGLKRLSPAFIDHGRVRMGAIVEDTLRLYHPGPGPVVIEKIKTTCGCMAAGFKALTVLPGDTVRIPYFFNTQGYVGVVRKNLTLVLRETRMIYTFQVQVVRDLEAQPRFIYLPSLPYKKDSLYICETEIHNWSDQNVHIDTLYCDTPELSAHPNQFTLPPESSRRLLISYRPVGLAMAQWTITLVSNAKDRPPLIIPFYVTFNEE